MIQSNQAKLYLKESGSSWEIVLGQPSLRHLEFKIHTVECFLCSHLNCILSTHTVCMKMFYRHVWLQFIWIDLPDFISTIKLNAPLLVEYVLPHSLRSCKVHLCAGFLGLAVIQVVGCFSTWNYIWGYVHISQTHQAFSILCFLSKRNVSFFRT